MLPYVFFGIFATIAVLFALLDRKALLLYFCFLYPVLPEYLSINISDGLPLLTATRLLLIILLISRFIVHPAFSLQPLKNSHLDKSLAFLILCNTIILIGHLKFGNTFKDYFGFWVEDVIFLVLFSNIVTDIYTWNNCIKAIMTSSVFSFIFGIFEPITNKNIASSFLNTNARTVLLVDAYERYGSIRASFTFGHAICLATYCVAFVPLFSNRMTENVKRKYIGILLCLGCLMMTISRWSIAVGLIILIVYIFKMDRQNRRKLVLPFVLFLFAFVIISLINPSVLNRILTPLYATLNAFGANYSIEGSTMNVNALSSRFLQLQMISQTFSQHPIVGFGSTDFENMNLWINSIGGRFKVNSIDMEYLNWFVSYGIIGFIGYLQWYISIIVSVRKESKRINDRIFTALFAGLIGLMLCYMAVDQLTTNRIFNMFLALIISRIEIEKRLSKERSNIEN